LELFRFDFIKSKQFQFPATSQNLFLKNVSLPH
jgi:hypothetical protein